MATANRRRTALLGQTWTLAKKNLTIILVHHSRSTLYTALVAPILVAVYLGVFVSIGQPQSKYGFGEPRGILSLADGLSTGDSSRDIVVFVDNGFTKGPINSVIEDLSDTVKKAGRNATRLSDENAIGDVCRSSVRGTTHCYGAVVFNSSPDQGDGGIWNYTLRADSSLGVNFKAKKDDNDAAVYTIPLQRAVDEAISRASSGSDSEDLSGKADEYGFTSKSEEQRQSDLRRDFQNTFISYLAVAFNAALLGIVYHMAGMIATERENGMSQLIDSMMFTKHDWETQVARLLSYFVAFGMVYLPGWIVASILVKVLIWKHTNAGIIIIYFVIAGFGLTSTALLGATFFRKAQLAGIINSVVVMALGIAAQALSRSNIGAVTVLSLLFTPCNLVFFVTYIARFEKDKNATDLIHAADDGHWQLPGIVLWVFIIIQIFAYPIIAALLERLFHGVASDRRKLFHSENTEKSMPDAVIVDRMTKIYRPSLFRRIFSFVSRPRPPTVAVNELTLKAKRGQILALLGANGSGKSTTLDSIAGISKFNSGQISVDTTGGLGIAPQKNVLWDDLNVEQNITLFNRLKAPHKPATRQNIRELIEAIGLTPKIKATAKTLSGGQKRKLQLGMMLTGGSTVCCVDEVSSGIDPLSRRKIWDILLAERGCRTIIMTTHFLDEADLLADHIAILSKGTLRAEGSSAELKDTLGAGYRVHVLDARGVQDAPEIDGVRRRVSTNEIEYVAPSSGLAAQVIRALEAAGHRYRLSGPTIEDVFLHVAEEIREAEDLKGSQRNGTAEQCESQEALRKGSESSSLELLSGRPIGFARQTWVLIMKRFTILKTNWIPYIIAFLVPIVAAAITQILIKDGDAPSCAIRDSGTRNTLDDAKELFEDILVVAGPSAQIQQSQVTKLLGSILPNTSSDGGSASFGGSNLKLVDSYSAFQDFIEDRRADVGPAGIWLGDKDSTPTLAYLADKMAVFTATTGQNLLDVLKSNVSIATAYKPFDSPIPSSTGSTLQVVLYFGFASALFPAFFALYPNLERRMNVRGLQYSSGVRSLPLWASHTLFDFTIILVSLAIAVAIYAATSEMWYHAAYLFPVFIFYGLASLLFGYAWSLVMGSQLSTYAAAGIYQIVGLLIYIIAFLFIVSFSPATDTDTNVFIGHFVIAIFFPIGSLIRSLLVALNVFMAACDGQELRSNPGSMLAFGGPILYLVVQCVLAFGLLLWYDSGAGFSIFKRRRPIKAPDDSTYADQEVQDEMVRVTAPDASSEGLQVKHLTKSFGNFTAVNNVSFGVDHGQVFALLGPNGAGKSTTISLIRGDLRPSHNGGDVFVENVSVSRSRAAARRNMGVCPQFDAIDSMTVVEHLSHYARIRGITDVKHQVEAVIQAVGLQAFRNTMAPHLSGGNKRKLSLGLALTGNPSVILLDEPSSGLDAAAKRIMWRTLEKLVPGRSILLTTHSMEEADALATRAGIVAQRMLAVGTTEHLCERFGDSLHVHLVSKTAPYSTTEEMTRIHDWIMDRFPGAEVESNTYHGQMRFSVPASSVRTTSGDQGSAIGRLVVMLEEHKEELGISHHSVSPTTLNQVFLTIVGNHDVQEEGYTNDLKNKSLWKKILWVMKF